jgi:hypothetical protein
MRQAGASVTGPLICALIFASGGAHAALDILVPAYANPCCGGGPAMWEALVGTAGDPGRGFELHVLFNPASGPGTGRDPNYLDAGGAGPLADLRAAGGVIHGYVATGYAGRPVAEALADVDAYLTGHYAGHVDGIFFDEMSNDLADTGYYRQLHAHVQASQPGARTFGNPGTPFTINPSGQTAYDANDYLDSLDTIITFENTADQYRDGYVSFPHLEGLDRRKTGHIVHSQPVWDPAVLDLAVARGAGFFYVTDDTMPPDDNPYDTLPGYWAAFTEALSARNAAEASRHHARPLPGPPSLLLATALVGAAGMAHRMR